MLISDWSADVCSSDLVHCSVWLRRCPCHCSSWKVVMADKAEAIQFGDSLPLAEPANLAARLECSFRSNLKKNAIVGADTAMDYGRLAKLTEHYALEIAACTAPQALVPVLSTGGADYCVAILPCIRAHRPFVPVDA